MDTKMELEFSLENEKPIELSINESLFDKEKEFTNLNGQRAQEMRLLMAKWQKEKQALKYEFEQIQTIDQKAIEELLLNFAKQHYELKRTLQKIQDQGIDKQLAGIYDRLVDIQVRLEEIFFSNHIEIEDVSGKPVNYELFDVKGSVKVPDCGAGLVIEAFSPLVWYKDRVLHRAEVMVSS